MTFQQDVLDVARKSRYTSHGVKKRYWGPVIATWVLYGLGYRLAGWKGVWFSFLAQTIGSIGTLYNGIRSEILVYDKTKL